VHLTVLVAAVVQGAWLLFKRFSSPPQGAALGLVAIVTIIATCLPLCFLPVTATDALVHHLAVPKWWFEAGRIAEIPWHEWSYYPMLLNLGYLGLFTIHAPQLCGVYHLLFFLLIVAIVVEVALEITDDLFAARLAALLTVSLPVLVKLSTIPLVDLGLALSSLIAVGYFQRYLKDRRYLSISLAGIALGCAASTKYNGVLYAAIVTVVFVAGISRERGWLNATIILITCVALPLLPWLLKNWYWTGNPIYPLMKRLLGGPILVASGGPRGLNPIQHRMLIYGESWWDILLLPLRVFFQGEDNDPRRFDGVMNPILALGLLLPLIKPGRIPLVTMWFPSAIFLVYAMVLSSARIRYLAPILPSLCICTALSLQRLVTARSLIQARLMTTVVIFFSFLLLAHYAMTELYSQAATMFVSGRISSEQYLTHALPEYPLIQFINRELSPESKIYLIGTRNPFYYFNRSVLSRGYFSANEVIGWLRTGRSPSQISDAFHAIGISHLMVNTGKVQQLLRESLTSEELARWNEFCQRYLEGVAESQEFSLWKLMNRSES